MRPEDTEMASGEVADEELADMTLEELLSDLPENHPITKAVRTLELEAADLRERLAKAREEAIEECVRECDKVGRMLSYGAGYACKIAAKEIRALKQKGADHE